VQAIISVGHGEHGLGIACVISIGILPVGITEPRTCMASSWANKGSLD
jgi:hypothetical protein